MQSCQPEIVVTVNESHITISRQDWNYLQQNLMFIPAQFQGLHPVQTSQRKEYINTNAPTYPETCRWLQYFNGKPFYYIVLQDPPRDIVYSLDDLIFDQQLNVEATEAIFNNPDMTIIPSNFTTSGPTTYFTMSLNFIYVV
jgi:hypothetical protein